MNNNQNIDNEIKNTKIVTFEELEESRIKYRNTILICILVVIGITALILAFNIDSTFLPFVIILFVVISVFICSKPNKKYKSNFKDYFVKASLNNIFTDLVYKPDSGISRDVIASTGMMYMGDIYTSNDYISGKYKNINVVQADVHIQEEHQTTDSDGNTTTTYVTIFKGRWMIFDFNKTFKANVQVCQKGFGNNKVNTLFSKSRYQKVEMESDDFNKRFKTYAQDPHDAFYILTPSLMEKITRLDDNNKGKLLLCFINNQLHVGIYDNKDSFEPTSCFKKLDINKISTMISTDISKITMFVDELNLDNDLFRKGV